MGIKVSVIIPVYNVEAYIEKCLESVLNQTEKNIEILAVDDGSQDASPHLCDVMAEKDSRLRVIHQKNQGVSVARNAGVAAASGEWLCFIDGDDYVAEDYLEELLQCADIPGTDIVVGDYYVLRETENAEYSEFILDKHSEDFQEYELIENCMIGNKAVGNVTCVGVPWAKIYRTSFVKKENLKFKDGLKRNQDVIFNLYAFHWAQRVSYYKGAGYFYRVWENSAVNRYSADYGDTVEQILREMKKFIDLNDDDNIYMPLYYQRVRDMFYECLRLSVFHKDAPKDILKKYQKFRGLCHNNILSLRNCPDEFLNTSQKIQKIMIKLHLSAFVFVVLYLKDLFR